MKKETLPPERLRRRCDLTRLPFETTEELDDLDVSIGQGRAVDALRFGVGIRHRGYNLFVLGPAGAGKGGLVRRFVSEQAQGQVGPPDWVYVNNFDEPHRPRALRLPKGRGVQLRRDMDRLVDDLRNALPAAFESDDYRSRVQAIEHELEERQEHALEAIQEKARARGIALIRTPSGFAFAPTKDDEVIKPEDFEKLSDEEKARIESSVSDLQEDLQKMLHRVPRWRKENRDRIRDLNREVAAYAAGALVEEVKKPYQDLEEVVAYLDVVLSDVVENESDFRHAEQEGPMLFGVRLAGSEAPSFNRYKINLVVGHDGDNGAPVVYEDNPNYQNLVGRVEHLAQMGALVTDFTMIKAGALHRANGGYLVLDVRKVLMQPYAWEGLKRALRSGELRIESLGQALSLVSTVSLDPEPIPLDAKVVLLGDRYLYYLLSYYDDEFNALFKVAVDFEDSVDWDDERDQQFARLVATVARQEQLRHFDRSGVARIIEHGARLAEDAGKLSTHMRSLADLMREADYFAGTADRSLVGAEDVQRAIDAKIDRLDRLRDRVQEEIQRGTIFIDTEGERVGQVNGLSVLALGEYHFGQPSRITARVRLGEPQVVDIDREVELGGPLHSKGVLILTGFISGRYALDRPLTLSASLVFEQSYGEVEGDSASSAELYALLSALADLPVRQSLAVTGSVNQHGEIQPIGGVNDKIEGFFDVCRTRGLNGRQGVLIPESNVKHLMLRDDVVEAVRNGEFAIYPVRTIDEGIELLTGMEAGERGKDGRFPADTVNGRVEQTLTTFSERMHAFVASLKSGEDDT